MFSVSQIFPYKFVYKFDKVDCKFSVLLIKVAAQILLDVSEELKNPSEVNRLARVKSWALRKLFRCKREYRYSQRSLRATFNALVYKFVREMCSGWVVTRWVNCLKE